MKHIYWWLRPFTLILFFVMPIYLVICYKLFVNDFTINGQFTYFHFRGFFIVLFLIVIFAFGALIGEKLEVFKVISVDLTSRSIHFFLLITGFLTIFAYLVWFLPLIFDPVLLFNVLTGRGGASYIVRETLSTIPGVTTLTQFGIVFCIAYIVYNNEIRKSIRLFKSIFIFILIITVFRALVWSERLAVLEVFIPVFCALLMSGKLSLNRFIGVNLPYLGILFAILFFMIFEYNRSWLSYYVFLYDSILEFSTDRFLEYYLVAVNNGFGMMTVHSWPTYIPAHSFKFLYEFPVIGGLFQYLLPISSDFHADFLYYFGEPEFNNVSGLLILPFEIGYFSLFFSLLTGFGLGFLYKHSLNIKFYRVIYLSFFIGIIEVLRFAYYSEGRFFSVLVCCFLFYLLRFRRL